LKRNGIRAAFTYANSRGHLSTLRGLRPDYLAELRQLGMEV
jgi:hypothetical protein